MIPDIPTANPALQQLIPSPEAVACLPETAARRMQLVPLATGRTSSCDWLMVACVNPSDPALRERLERHIPAGLRPVLVLAGASDIPEAIDKCYRHGTPVRELATLCQNAGTASEIMKEQPDIIVRLLENLLLQASRIYASDIHLSPEDQCLHVRVRVDGVLQPLQGLSVVMHAGLLVRIKILASMDIAETRRPQDGQFSQFIDGKRLDFRVSCFPTVDGQNCVIRLLDSQFRYDTLERLRLPAQVHDCLAELAQRPDGLLVVCGPTGSGKSNTLHALVRERDATSLNIMTLEDPVERVMAGVRQSDIDAEHAMDFAQGVRGLLRQDPDVLLIGEVRDSPSCAMTLRAVMSGHQVLTSVHASSALAGLARLQELGALAGQLAENLVAIASQRLVRRICKACDGRGDPCVDCRGSGYYGRQLIMELLPVTPAIAVLIAARACQTELLECAQQQGFRTMQEQGMRLVRQGVTSHAELERVLGKVNRQECQNREQGGVQDECIHQYQGR